jgi:hypothetical protein
MLSKALLTQFTEAAGSYTIFAYDIPLVYLCTIWKGEVPHGVVSGGYSQAQNDADRAEFEADWKESSNKALQAHEIDGRAIVTPYPAALGTQTQFVGGGDDVAQGLPGEGPLLEFAFLAPGTLMIEVQYIGMIQVADGAAIYSGSWSAQDRLSFGVRIPANVAVPNVGSTGNCSLIPIGGGANMIVPAAGDGTHDVNLVTAAPILMPVDGASPWYVDRKLDGLVPAPMNDGNAILLDVEKILWLVRHVPVGAADGHWDIDVYRAETIHPNWFLRAEIVKTSAGAGILSGELLIYRLNP